eukprot:snap_masked-scaffold_1-processed-gene-17.7-mRNA-1 protein AED:1.00 eAED:1.00 QI:0/0/0/0/1/1/2/0/150
MDSSIFGLYRFSFELDTVLPCADLEAELTERESIFGIFLSFLFGPMLSLSDLYLLWISILCLKDSLFKPSLTFLVTINFLDTASITFNSEVRWFLPMFFLLQTKYFLPEDKPVFKFWNSLESSLNGGSVVFEHTNVFKMSTALKLRMANI